MQTVATPRALATSARSSGIHDPKQPIDRSYRGGLALCPGTAQLHHGQPPMHQRLPPPHGEAGPIIGGRVELQLLTTLKCNLKCTYCSLGVGEVLGSQNEVRYDIDQLAAFIERHLAGKEIYDTFYGGEPTLNRCSKGSSAPGG